MRMYEHNPSLAMPPLEAQRLTPAADGLEDGFSDIALDVEKSGKEPPATSISRRAWVDLCEPHFP